VAVGAPLDESAGPAAEAAWRQHAGEHD
jgi:hypothetical protein